MNLNVWWSISFVIMAVTLIGAFIISKLRNKRKSILTTNKALILGTFASIAASFLPLYIEEFAHYEGIEGYVRAILITVQHSIRLFGFDGGYPDFSAKVEGMEGLSSMTVRLYTGIGAFLYFFAPMLTFGVLLSFFKNISAYRRYILSFWKHTHVFSELNEKSLALAKSIDETYNKIGEGKKRRYRVFCRALIVFTGVSDKPDEQGFMYIEEAKEIDAILFSKDLESIKYRNRRFSIRKVNFYLISDNEKGKIHHAETIMSEYDVDGVELRIFSSDIRSELLLASQNIEHMKAIRVNDIQSLVYHNLNSHGLRLFKNARCIGNTDKIISAVIVGLGSYGLEMMKALTWFCQMDGYRIKINAFDIDKNARDHFAYMCPELMSEELNGQDIPGEARYEINVHSGVDINTPAFADELSKIKDATYIFVSLGDDEINLSTAVKIRTICERVNYSGDHHKPDIETVIYDSNIRNAMGVKWNAVPGERNPEGVSNFKSQNYDIHMIGDLCHFYSVDTLINSKLTEDGKKVHMRYVDGDDESDYWKYEYNYRSSIARALHEKISVQLGCCDPVVEHKRWNAYMRTEGYIYSGSKNESTKSHLAKVHHNLVPTAELSSDDSRKDE